MRKKFSIIASIFVIMLIFVVPAFFVASATDEINAAKKGGTRCWSCQTWYYTESGNCGGYCGPGGGSCGTWIKHPNSSYCYHAGSTYSSCTPDFINYEPEYRKICTCLAFYCDGQQITNYIPVTTGCTMYSGKCTPA